MAVQCWDVGQRGRVRPRLQKGWGPRGRGRRNRRVDVRGKAGQAGMESLITTEQLAQPADQGVQRVPGRPGPPDVFREIRKLIGGTGLAQGEEGRERLRRGLPLVERRRLRRELLPECRRDARMVMDRVAVECACRHPRRDDDGRNAHAQALEVELLCPGVRGHRDRRWYMIKGPTVLVPGHQQQRLGEEIGVGAQRLVDGGDETIRPGEVGVGPLVVARVLTVGAADVAVVGLDEGVGGEVAAGDVLEEVLNLVPAGQLLRLLPQRR